MHRQIHSTIRNGLCDLSLTAYYTCVMLCVCVCVVLVCVTNATPVTGTNAIRCYGLWAVVISAVHNIIHRLQCIVFMYSVCIVCVYSVSVVVVREGKAIKNHYLMGWLREPQDNNSHSYI